MNPKSMRDILKKLKTKRGCTIDDFAEWIPPAIQYVDPREGGGGLFYPIDDFENLFSGIWLKPIRAAV